MTEGSKRTLAADCRCGVITALLARDRTDRQTDTRLMIYALPHGRGQRNKAALKLRVFRRKITHTAQNLYNQVQPRICTAILVSNGNANATRRRRICKGGIITILYMLINDWVILSIFQVSSSSITCLLYTSDAADE